MLIRTSSHICGRWYLPMFLFRDGLFLLIYRASLIALFRFWSSLPTILKLSMVTEWPEMLRVVIYGGWRFQVFFKPHCKGSCWLPNVFFITFYPVTLISVDDSTFVEETYIEHIENRMRNIHAINRAKLKIKATASHSTNRKTSNSNPTQSSTPKPNIVVPYHQGLSESFEITCQKYGIQVHCKGGHTIKSLPMAPKDKDHILNKSGVIYRYKCHRVECDEEYIGESARTFAERFKECLKPPFPIYDHSNISGHSVTIDNFSIVGREDQNLKRAIKEALYIRRNNPSLNKNIGKYHLPHIWDEVLINITELQLK